MKFLVSGLQSLGVFALLFAGGIMVLTERPKSVSWSLSSADSIAYSTLGVRLIAFLRSTSTAKVQFDLIEGTLGRKL